MNPAAMWIWHYSKYTREFTRYLFNTVAKLTKNKASTGVDISQQHSSNDFMNYFTSKMNTIRDQIVTCSRQLQYHIK